MDKQRQRRRQMDRRGFLVIGIALIALGITMTATDTKIISIPFIGAGIVFLAICLGARAKQSGQPPSEPLPGEPEGALDAEATTPGEQS